MKLSISLALLACVYAQSEDSLRRQSRFCQNSMNELIKKIPGVIKKNFCAKDLDVEGLGLDDELKRRFLCIRAKCCKIGTCPKPEGEKPKPIPPVLDTKFCDKAKKKYSELFLRQGIDAPRFCGVDVSLVKFTSLRKHQEFCRIMAICCKIPKDECMPPKEEDDEDNEDKPNLPDLDKGKCKRVIKGWIDIFTRMDMKMGPFCEIDLKAVMPKLGPNKSMTLCKNMAHCCDNVSFDQCKPPEDDEDDEDDGDVVIGPVIDKKCRKAMGEFIRKVAAIKNYKDFCAFDRFLPDKVMQMKMCWVKQKCCGTDKADCMPKKEPEEKPEEKP